MLCFFTISNVAYAAEISSYEISAETQAAMAESIKQEPSNQDYFDAVTEQFYANIHTDSNDINNLLMSAVEGVNKVDESSSQDLNELLEEQEKQVEKNNQLRIEKTPYQTALSDYRFGIALVRKFNCPHTADSMEHAIVPENQLNTSWTPSNMYYTNDSWAKTLCLNELLQWDVERNFQNEILTYNKSYRTVSGDFVFTSSNGPLDAAMQLHKVH